MSDHQTCLDEEVLTAYLYDECEAAARARVEAHLAQCQACRAETDDLRRVRQHLAVWSPPEPALGFRVVAGPAWRPWAAAVSRWALPAAAVLVLAAAAAMARVELRYDGDGFVVRTGWERLQAPEPAMPAPPAPEPVADEATWRTELASLERRLRDELEATPPSGPTVAEADLLLRVRALIEESERRQQRELALRMTQLVRDFDSQRQTDLIRIEQGLGRLEGVTGAEAAQQRELLNYLVRVSSQR